MTVTLTDSEAALLRALTAHYRVSLCAQLRKDYQSRHLTEMGRRQYESDIAMAQAIESRLGAIEEVAA